MLAVLFFEQIRHSTRPGTHVTRLVQFSNCMMPVKRGIDMSFLPVMHEHEFMINGMSSRLLQRPLIQHATNVASRRSGVAGNNQNASIADGMASHVHSPSGGRNPTRWAKCKSSTRIVLLFGPLWYFHNELKLRLKEQSETAPNMLTRMC